MRILVSILANAAGLFATQIVPGIHLDPRTSVRTLVVAGVILGVFNLIVRPIATFLSLPLLILSLGLFYFVLNGLLLWAASFFLPGYHVGGIVPAILGALVLGIVNWAVHSLFGTNKKDD